MKIGWQAADSSLRYWNHELATDGVGARNTLIEIKCLKSETGIAESNATQQWFKYSILKDLPEQDLHEAEDYMRGCVAHVLHSPGSVPVIALEDNILKVSRLQLF